MRPVCVFIIQIHTHTNIAICIPQYLYPHPVASQDFYQCIKGIIKVKDVALFWRVEQIWSEVDLRCSSVASWILRWQDLGVILVDSPVQVKLNVVLWSPNNFLSLLCWISFTQGLMCLKPHFKILNYFFRNNQVGLGKVKTEKICKLPKYKTLPSIFV